MNELDEIKEILSDIIDEKDFFISLAIYSLCLYEPDIDGKKLALLFKERIMKGYEYGNEY